MREIPIIRAAAQRASLDASPLLSIEGETLATSFEAPALLMSRIVGEARRQPSQGLAERHAILARAGELFATAILAGESPAEYAVLAAASSGLPEQVFRRALGSYRTALAEMGRIVAAQKPRDALPLDSAELDGRTSAALWVPRGRVLAVIAPGNHPGAHVGWLQALAFGYNVVVKPSRKDVFTPLRLVRALLEAGLHAGEIAFAAGSHQAGLALVEAADLALVYGGPAAQRAFAGQPRVLVRGPGRAKLLVDARRPLSPETIAFLARCVAADGGTRCTNASAILVDGDHQALAEALARVLCAMPSLPPHDPAAELAVMSRDEAAATRAALDAARAGATDLCRTLDQQPAVTAIGERSAVLRPAVVALPSARAPGFALELGFPCVWVAPWQKQDGLAPLRDSLVVTLLSDDAEILAAALGEPSIRKVFHGEVPTYHSETGIPHDGALADFLFESKGYARQVRHAG
jgi:acyl-CoA reductase-like NAD-dependent aldehyde dehydrogenase